MRLKNYFISLNGKLNQKIVFHPANTCIELVHLPLDTEFEEQMTRELFLEYFNKMSFEDHANIFEDYVNILDLALSEGYNLNTAGQ